ncbi:hypothetical protein OH77DRAFT_1231015 [Trametes cingulata]|nr:hypothetical protein OH77DRAFT_1231015 [Trametes cingulata]
MSVLRTYLGLVLRSPYSVLLTPDSTLDHQMSQITPLASCLFLTIRLLSFLDYFVLRSYSFLFRTSLLYS